MSEVNTALSAPVERRLYTVAQFSERHPFATQGALRYQIFQRQENGLESSGALIRVGRKRLIDEEKYFQWMDDLQDKEFGPLRDKLTKSKKRMKKGNVKLSSNSAEVESEEMEDAK